MNRGSIPQIGRCIGCNQPSRLDDGVCDDCLTQHGRKWAELSNRCRTDPEFARAVYEKIATGKGRAMFLAMYGYTAPQGLGNIGYPTQKALTRELGSRN
jgi:predicted amidophosphoribosyltransferase